MNDTPVALQFSDAERLGKVAAVDTSRAFCKTLPQNDY